MTALLQQVAKIAAIKSKESRKSELKLWLLRAETCLDHAQAKQASIEFLYLPAN